MRLAAITINKKNLISGAISSLVLFLLFFSGGRALAYSWVQTTDDDFNAGTKTNISVQGNSFELSEPLTPCSSGAPVGCDAYDKKNECEGCGCTWSDSCSGMPLACSVYTKKNDCQACNCVWNDAKYETSGNLISQAFDTSFDTPTYISIDTNSTPPGPNRTVEVRAAADQAGLSAAAWYDESQISSVPHLRWVQWRVSLIGDGSETAGVHEVTVNYFSPPSGGAVLPTTLKISGKAYPGAQIVLVEKSVREEKLAKQKVTALENGDFEIANIGIMGDRYAYSLMIQDKEGRQTQTKVYDVDLKAIGASLVVQDLFVPPTIDLTRAVVTKGDFIKIVGFAFPSSKVKVELDKDVAYEAKADEAGNYQLLINTARLAFGRHEIRAKQEGTALKAESDFSLTRGFLVSDSIVPKADFSGDGKINITDWSIFLVLWKGRRQEADLDGSGRVDISDLSIFLRAVRI